MASSILDQFSVTSVEGLEKGKEKGRGCYGAVYEVRVHGSPCIAKRLHSILVGNGGDVLVSKVERRAVIDRFREECVLLSSLRHPNVVQFMGVHYGRDEADISLIMEYMHMDLDQCMKTYPDIPLPYKTSILRDVAYGLAYLHSIPIIHRDLNAGNVLLTESLRAKIADLGVAKLFDMDTLTHRTKSPCPGALDFMPPESFEKKPKYDAKLDCFSFGHLILYLANQQFPRVVDSAVTPKDVKKKQMQVAKRREALNQMGTKHPLYSIAVQCLSDTPSQRHTSRDLVKKMEELCKKQPLPHKDALQTLTENQELREKLRAEEAETKRNVQQLEADLKDSQHTAAELIKEGTQLRAELQKTVDTNKKQRQEQDSIAEELKAKLMVQVKENSELLEQFRALKNHHVKLVEEQSLNYDHINARQRQLEAKDCEIAEKDRVLKDKDLVVEEKSREIEEKSREIEEKGRRLDEQECQLASRELEIVELHHQIELYQTQAAIFKDDFEHERKESELVRVELLELRDTSALIIAGLEGTIRDLKGETNPIQYQPEPIHVEPASPSQATAVSSEQIDAYKRDLDEEKKQNMLLKDRIDLLSGYQEMADRQKIGNEWIQKLAGLQQDLEASRTSSLEQEVKRLEEEIERLKQQNRILEDDIAELRASNQQQEVKRVMEEEIERLKQQNSKLEDDITKLRASNQITQLLHCQQAPQQTDGSSQLLLAVRHTCHHRTPSQDSVATSNDYESCDESPSDSINIEPCSDS